MDFTSGQNDATQNRDEIHFGKNVGPMSAKDLHDGHPRKDDDLGDVRRGFGLNG